MNLCMLKAYFFFGILFLNEPKNRWSRDRRMKSLRTFTYPEKIHPQSGFEPANLEPSTLPRATVQIVSKMVYIFPIQPTVDKKSTQSSYRHKDTMKIIYHCQFVHKSVGTEYTEKLLSDSTTCFRLQIRKLHDINRITVYLFWHQEQKTKRLAIFFFFFQYYSRKSLTEYQKRMFQKYVNDRHMLPESRLSSLYYTT